MYKYIICQEDHLEDQAQKELVHPSLVKFKDYSELETKLIQPTHATQKQIR